MVSFDLVFHRLSENDTFFYFYQGEQSFCFLNGENMNHLKAITMVSMETKFASQDSILEKLSEKFTWVDSEKGNRDLLGGGNFCSKPAVSLIFDPEVRQELSPLPLIWSTGTTSLPWQQQPLWRKTVCGNREGASPKDTCDIGICVWIAVSREERMLWSSCGFSQGKWCNWAYDTYRWRANTRKWATEL